MGLCDSENRIKEYNEIGNGQNTQVENWQNTQMENVKNSQIENGIRNQMKNEQSTQMENEQNIKTKIGDSIQIKNDLYIPMKNGQCSQNPSGQPNINLSTITNIGSSQGSFKFIYLYNFSDNNNNNGYFFNNIQNSYPNNNTNNIPKIEEEKLKLLSDFQSQKTANQALNIESNNLINITKKVKEQNNELQNQLKNKDNIIKQKDNDIAKLQKTVLELKANLKNKENEFNTKFNNLITQNKTKYENQISQLQTEIEKYKSEKKQNEKEFLKYNTEKSDLKKELEKLKQTNSILLMDKKPTLVGLNNIGATCYMNATLQCLSNTTKLTTYFLKMFKYDINNKKKIMSNEYYNVVKNLWDHNNNNKSFSPYSFKEKLSQENPLFKGIQANDSKDLINFLLERFHLELNEPIKDQNNNRKENYSISPNDQLNENKMLNLFINEFTSKYNSIISHLFYGMIETKSQCMRCKNIKYNFQIYSFLEFPLEQVNKYCFSHGKRQNFNSNNKNPDIDLYECFEYNCNIDLMAGDNQMYCNICNSNQDALYGTQIYSAPNYLIINLNRGRGAVYECKVNFPEKLNILNFITFKTENTVFELYSVISHLGPSSMSGHFVAYCKRREDDHYKWYLFNDAIVSECKKKEEYRNGMPYILFYKAI